MDALERVTIKCPNCGQETELTIERTSGRQSYVDECSICCGTIQLEVEVNEDAELNVTVHREDD